MRIIQTTLYFTYIKMGVCANFDSGFASNSAATSVSRQTNPNPELQCNTLGMKWNVKPGPSPSIAAPHDTKALVAQWEQTP